MKEQSTKILVSDQFLNTTFMTSHHRATIIPLAKMSVQIQTEIIQKLNEINKAFNFFSCVYPRNSSHIASCLFS